MSNVLAKIEVLQDKSKRRAELAESLKMDVKSELAQVLFGFTDLDVGELPDWPESSRGVPNSILRSALFSAIKRGPRTYHSAVEMASVEGVRVIFTGPQLDQADLDVWEQCLHISRARPLGSSVEFSAHNFLKSIGRPTGKSQRDWLKGSFLRLMTSVIELKDGDKSYAGQLVHHHLRDDETGLQSITINPKIVRLYGGSGWTRVEWEDRMALKKHPLAQWLHGFYSTHAKPYDYRVETIHKLCGSQAKNVTDFRKDVRRAMEVMGSTIGWKGELSPKGLVSMVKPPSSSQQRHLKNKTQAK